MSVITIPDITILRTVRQLIIPDLYLRIGQQAAGIPLSAQMFVRNEAFPSSPDSKDIQIQIIYHAHVR